MSENTELRIHGVSGTPPRAILYTDPVAVGNPGPFTTVYSVPESDEDFTTTAFHWGGLTSGNWTTAFWILLAPFVFANVAGWMTRRPRRLATASVRLAGLGLSTLFTTQAMTALVLIPVMWVKSKGAGPQPQRIVAATLVLGAATGFVVLVWRFATRSHTEEWGFRDKAQLLFGLVDKTVGAEGPQDPISAGVSQQEFLGGALVVHHLRKIHLAAGLTSMGWIATRFAGEDRLALGLLVALGVIVLALVVYTLAPGSPVATGTVFMTPWIAIAGVGVGIGTVLGGPVGWQPAAVHEGVFAISGALYVFALLSISAGGLALGATVIGTQLGGVLGIAAALAMETVFSISDAEPESALAANGAGWVAVAMLGMIETLAIWALLMTFRNPAHSAAKRFGGMLRRITINSQELLYVAAVYGIVVGGWAVYQAARCGSFNPHCLGNPNESLWAGRLVLWLGLGVVLLAVHRIAYFYDKSPLALVGGIAVAGGVLVVAARLFRDWLGIEFDEGLGLVATATLLVILIPGSLMFRSIVGGVSTGTEQRRKVGILWDLGSFWPRWFHPLAPPAYGPAAIKSLLSELTEHSRHVVGAHSQGSLITAVVIDQLATENQPKGFLSYGSQLGKLYPTLFPAAGIGELVDRLATHQTLGWVNLYRESDPIGGHYVETLGEYDRTFPLRHNRSVATGWGHGRYEQSETYRTERARLLTDPPPPANQSAFEPDDPEETDSESEQTSGY